jgi:hypothetical protein
LEDPIEALAIEAKKAIHKSYGKGGGKMKTTGFFILTLLFLSTGAWGQARKPATITELVTYRGADREALLYAGAKSEGRIVWYTSLAGDSYKELVKAFETKYPGVKVDSYRAQGADLVVRLQEDPPAMGVVFTELSQYSQHLIERLLVAPAMSRDTEG